MIIGVPALIWLIGGLLLMLAELVMPGAFLVWIGLAALGTGLATLAGLGGLEPQVVCFGVLAAASIALALRLRRHPAQRVNTPGSGLVGRTAEVLVFRGEEGRVRLGDSDWPAQLAANTPPPAPGTRLRVVGVRGLVLLVGPLDP